MFYYKFYFTAMIKKQIIFYDNDLKYLLDLRFLFDLYLFLPALSPPYRPLVVPPSKNTGLEEVNPE